MKKRFNIKSIILFLLICFASSIQQVKAEDVLRMLVWEGYTPEKQVKIFESYIQQKYNKSVKLKIQYISDPNDFFDGIRSKEIDIISPTHNLLKDARFNFIKNKILLPVDLDNVPNYKQIIHSLQNADYAESDGNVYAVPFVHGPYGLGYNAGILNAPDSWNIFWDPKFKNKYSISSDYYEVNIYITGLSLGYKGNQLSTAEVINNPEFKNKLRELAQNAGSLWEGVDTAEALKNQSIAAVWGFSFPELSKQGQIWKIAEPKEGTMGFVDNFAIGYALKDKPFLKKVAEEWLNYAISPDFQVEAVVRGLGSAPVNLSIRDQLTPEENAQYHMEDPDFFQNNRILWPTLKRTRDRNIMKMLWEKSMMK